MYLNHFSLKTEPFHITPDPEFLFLSPSHKEALATVIYGVKQRKGFVQITGEVGVGKTTILRSYLEQNLGARLKTIYIFNPNLSFPSLLKTICSELGVTRANDDTNEMLSGLHQGLIEEYSRGGTVALIIDEAQNMPMETLENLRMLSNLETAKDKLIQIIFSGQPEFEQLLNRHELRQLKQRMAISATITRLSKAESAGYIRHRLTQAGLRQGATLFTPAALKRIVTQAKGIPRSINILCDNALLTAFGYQKKKVDRAIAREIIADSKGKKVRSRNLCRVWLAVLLIIAIVLGWLLSHEYTFTSGVTAQKNSAIPDEQVQIGRSEER